MESCALRLRALNLEPPNINQMKQMAQQRAVNAGSFIQRVSQSISPAQKTKSRPKLRKAAQMRTEP
eukprot:CAMPEP_0181521622 /NCGR_PEP_ID=MMETSP1110-20121109/66933_1 /TAXON_ID=174948 /ORGANISM="Symbiodinium sp., Strain CCMP421" /LENGTH=65 /DNA_ID=CAMNT_0023652173 /DNA_START=73 /DNA_END=267 /DNA_ORIENTATION=+